LARRRASPSSPGQLGALLSFRLFRLSQFGTLSRCCLFSTGNVGSLVRFLFACPRLFGVLSRFNYFGLGYLGSPSNTSAQ
jgi:hypothetical protein